MLEGVVIIIGKLLVLYLSTIWHTIHFKIKKYEIYNILDDAKSFLYLDSLGLVFTIIMMVRDTKSQIYHVQSKEL